MYTPEKVQVFVRFFKTGKGEYGEGDQFYGISVPQSRSIAKKFQQLALHDIAHLLASPIHEERLIALLILVMRYQKGDQKRRQEVFDFYLDHTKHINNWDLVDLSVYKIVGDYLGSYCTKQQKLYYITKLACSKNMWEQRMAMVATYAFIMREDSSMTFRVAEMFLNMQPLHDLLQKAMGWMLREVGKRVSEEEEVAFLNKHYKNMPRTALRYAIERFSPELREKYLKGKV